jgi:tRNA uridine 5-carboxymethylaminomethyl modification enzyme
MQRVKNKITASKEIEKFFSESSIAPDQINGFLSTIDSSPLTQKVKLLSVLLRPNVDIKAIADAVPFVKDFISKYDEETILLSEVGLKYEGYIKKEQELVEKMERLESVKIRPDFDYKSLVSLSAEAREKLSKMQPGTIGQASRISGVSPSDISILLVHMGR